MKPIFQPILALVCWSLVMMVWATIARLRAMHVLNDPAVTRKPGTRGSDLDGILPPEAQWPSHNYNHLMEQPTLFYAVSFLLALSGGGTGLGAHLAWAYVALRVIHSLVQATVNILQIRFPVHALASLALLAMAARAAYFVF
jgi:hypothetical protein